MILNKNIAKKIIFNIQKTFDFDVNIIDNQGIIVDSASGAGIGRFSADASKAVISGTTLIVNKKTEEADGGRDGELLLPIIFEEKVLGVVGVVGLIDDIHHCENVLTTIVELVLERGYELLHKTNNNYDGLVASIINSSWHDQHKKGKLKDLLGKDAGYVAVVFEIFQEINNEDLTSSQLQEVIYSLGGGEEGNIVEMISPRQLVMLKRVKTGRKEWDYRDIMTKLEDYYVRLSKFPGLVFFISCGNPYEGIERMAISYQSAIQSLTIGKALFPQQNIYSYKEMALDVLLLSTSNNWTSEHLTKSYHNLISKDKNGCLQKTLKCLFGANLNVGKAAENLHVHRNTLRYRLNKIREYTDMDLNEIDNMFLLYSAFKLHRMDCIKAK